jgi:hypothetical protein
MTFPSKSSPYDLLQEQQIGKPHAVWRILVVCAMLNKTDGRGTRNVVPRLFELADNPVAFSELTGPQIYDLLRPLGLVTRRMEALIAITQDYLAMGSRVDSWKTADWVTSIRFCGQYAMDSVNIFVYDKLENRSKDPWLQKYLEWRATVDI